MATWAIVFVLVLNWSFNKSFFFTAHFSCLSVEQRLGRKDKYERLREQRNIQLGNKLHLSVWSRFLHSCCKYDSAVGRIQ